jgi:hypothetical protein
MNKERFFKEYHLTIIMEADSIEALPDYSEMKDIVSYQMDGNLDVDNNLYCDGVFSNE